MFRSDCPATALLAALALGLLGGCGLTTAPSDLSAPKVPVWVSVNAAWSDDHVQDQLAAAQRRFAECGVALSFTNMPGVSASREIHFVSSIERINGDAIEGRAFALRMPKRAEIAWATPNGTPLEHKQTVAHELGHLFGLGHAPLHSINLMAPHGCELCRFSAAQCRTIEEHAKAPL